MKNILNIIESVLGILVYLGLGIGILIFLFFGLMDVTNTSRIGFEANHVLVGSIGLLLAAANIFALKVLGGKKPMIQLIAAGVIIALSVSFALASPMRFGAFFGHGDPAQLAAYWAGACGLLLIVLVGAQMFTGRAE